MNHCRTSIRTSLSQPALDSFSQVGGGRAPRGLKSAHRSISLQLTNPFNRSKGGLITPRWTMRHYRLTCLFALVSVALVATMSSCSRPSDPAVAEHPPVRQVELPPVRMEPAEENEPVKENLQESLLGVIGAQKPLLREEPRIGKQGEPKKAVDKAEPKAAPPSRKS